MTDNADVIPFQQIRMADIEQVGGKNASLGEMIGGLSDAGIRVPAGFATTAKAYRDFLGFDGLAGRIHALLDALDIEDVAELARVGALIRKMILDTPLPGPLEAAIRIHYADLMSGASQEVSVAVRSSATAEDLPDASFAGQQESFLNVRGLDAVLNAVHQVFASLFNDRAISYRIHKDFAHSAVALSAGIQRMIRSDIGASGVIFTLDTESGFRDVVFLTSSWGLGEMVVQGAVNPDEFYVHKPMLGAGKAPIIRRTLGSKAEKMRFANASATGRPVEVVEVAQAERDRFSLTDGDVIELARYAVQIEQHYGFPMDIEWAKDGGDGLLYILQARPETVKSRPADGSQERFRLLGKSEILASGRAIGHKIGVGTVRVVKHATDMGELHDGDVLVTDMTDPNWEPIMKRASAIVTNRGGRTCHAAIIARELGIPAVVGSGDATERLRDGETVTVSCSEGDTGHVYRGALAVERSSDAIGPLPVSPVKIMMNVGNPSLAFDFQKIPNDGVGLARLEFVINNMIGVHPRAILDHPKLPPEIKSAVDAASRGYATPRDFFVTKVMEGVATIAAAFWPKPVIVRLSDFKSNEYRKLVGGAAYEPEEENPMLGFRGASRYVAPSFRPCFELECEAMRRVRDEMGLTNVELMIPFVRTVAEAANVVHLLAENGLRRGSNGLRVIMMCELPSNALLAEQFLEYFDGFSIGSNDLTQLTLGLDRDSGLVAEGFDERDGAVKALLSMAITACRKANKYIGICGQGPSDHTDFALWLVEQGIGSLSLNPDTVVDTWRAIAGWSAGRAA